jgi:hypothetical protein
MSSTRPSIRLLCLGALMAVTGVVVPAPAQATPNTITELTTLLEASRSSSNESALAVLQTIEAQGLGGTRIPAAEWHTEWVEPAPPPGCERPVSIFQVVASVGSHDWALIAYGRPNYPPPPDQIPVPSGITFVWINLENLSGRSEPWSFVGTTPAGGDYQARFTDPFALGLGRNLIIFYGMDIPYGGPNCFYASLFMINDS